MKAIILMTPLENMSDLHKESVMISGMESDYEINWANQSICKTA